MRLRYRLSGVQEVILLKTFYHTCIINKRLDFVFVFVGPVDIATLAVRVGCGEVAIENN